MTREKFERHIGKVYWGFSGYGRNSTAATFAFCRLPSKLMGVWKNYDVP